MPDTDPAEIQDSPAKIASGHTAFARTVLDAEAAAIQRVELNESFDAAVELIGRITTSTASGGGGGSLVVSGLGKSGLIGQKLSATFASTGTPSHFLHPVEAMHGDLGRVRKEDVVLLMSFGGGTEEVVTLASLLKQDAVPTIALVGRAGSDLGRLATVPLAIGDVTEACPHNLAPTASTTAMLALGDALALAVMRLRDFGAQDFHKYHPGGGLGKQLMPVVEAMRFKVGSPGAKGAGSPGVGIPGAGANLPLIHVGTSVQKAYEIAEQSAKASGLRRPGALIVVDDTGRLAGFVTDGDLRSALIKRGPEVWLGAIDGIMTANPTTLTSEALIRDAVHIVREHRFDEIPIVDGAGKPVGLIDVQDLAALKVIEG